MTISVKNHSKSSPSSPRIYSFSVSRSHLMAIFPNPQKSAANILEPCIYRSWNCGGMQDLYLPPERDERGLSYIQLQKSLGAHWPADRHVLPDQLPPIEYQDRVTLYTWTRTRNRYPGSKAQMEIRKLKIKWKIETDHHVLTGDFTLDEMHLITQMNVSEQVSLHHNAGAEQEAGDEPKIVMIGNRHFEDPEVLDSFTGSHSFLRIWCHVKFRIIGVFIDDIAFGTEPHQTAGRFFLYRSGKAADRVATYAHGYPAGRDQLEDHAHRRWKNITPICWDSKVCCWTGTSCLCHISFWIHPLPCPGKPFLNISSLQCKQAGAWEMNIINTDYDEIQVQTE